MGLSAEDLGVSQEVLDTHYLLQVALLDTSVREEVEANCIAPFLDVHKSERIPTVDDYREVEGLEVRPPDVWRYFVRVKKEALEAFAEENGLKNMDPAKLEDEFIYQNSFKLNQKYYASLGDQQAFVLSHGKNLMILKIVGYAEKVVEYYKAGRLSRPRLDRPSALSHQGPRMAPRRRAPVHRAQRSLGS